MAKKNSSRAASKGRAKASSGRSGASSAPRAKSASKGKAIPKPRTSAKPARGRQTGTGVSANNRGAHARPATIELDENTHGEIPAGESGLSDRDLEMFKQLLLEKRAELVGDVNTLHGEASRRNQRDATGNLSSMPIHMADLGTDNYELEFTLGLIEGERAVIREIDEALERIENKTYGVCAATGKPIGKARLKAKPWAKYSYEYTLAQEQGRQPRL